MHKPKVLLVTHTHKPVIGGSTEVYDQLAKRVKRIGLSIFTARRNVDTFEWIQGVDEFDSNAPYTIYRTNEFRTADKGIQLSRLRRHMRDAMLFTHALFNLRQLIKREGIELVIVGNVNSLSSVAHWAALGTGAHVAQYLHGEEITTHLHSLRAEAKRERYLDASTANFCASQHCYDSLVALRPNLRNRSFVVGNGVDLSRFQTSVPHAQEDIEERGTKDTLRLIGVGRQVERKGFDTAIRVISILKKRGHRVHLTLIGEGPLLDHHRSIVKELGLDDRVDILGRVDEVKMIQSMRSSDVFIMPNRTLPDGDTEGFGLVFLEANAMGKPVIGGRAGGAVNAVDEGVSGFLVDPLNVQMIADLIIKLDQDRDLLRTLSESAQWHARKNDWDVIATSFETQVLQLLGN